MISEAPLLLALQVAAAALGLAGQYFVNRKRIKGYYLWVGANVVLIPVSLHAGLYVLSALYAVYLGLCVHGILSWKRLDPMTDAFEKLGFSHTEARSLRASLSAEATPAEARELVRQALLTQPCAAPRC